MSHPECVTRRKKNEIVIGVADWHIIRNDRTNIRISSLDLIVKSMPGNNEVRFGRLDKNQPGQYDGIIAFGVFSKEEMEFLRMQSYAIVFINSDSKNYEYDSIVMDFNKGIHEMLDYLMDRKKYRSVGYIGGLYEEGQVKIGYRRLEGIKASFTERGYYAEENFYIGDISRESGYEMAKKAILSGPSPGGVSFGERRGGRRSFGGIPGCRAGVFLKMLPVVIYKDIEDDSVQVALLHQGPHVPGYCMADIHQAFAGTD